jgi:hypothetical protein
LFNRERRAPASAGQLLDPVWGSDVLIEKDGIAVGVDDDKLAGLMLKSSAGTAGSTPAARGPSRD